MAQENAQTIQERLNDLLDKNLNENEFALFLTQYAGCYYYYLMDYHFHKPMGIVRYFYHETFGASYSGYTPLVDDASLDLIEKLDRVGKLANIKVERED